MLKVVFAFCEVFCLIQDSSANVEFSCDAELCLSQQVEYQCTAGASLRWRISDETMSTLGSRAYLSDDTVNISESIGGAPDFSTVLISNTNPLISNISFTVQSSIEDYTIECETPGVDSNECVINIAAIPSSPLNLMLSSYTLTSVVLSWSPPSVSSQCVTSYTINSTTNDTEITSTDTSVTLDVPVNHDSSTQYCVSVAAVDIVNRTGQHSDSMCFILDVPSSLELEYELFNGSTNNTGNIGVSWSSDQSTRPPILSYYLTHNGSDNSDEIAISSTSYLIEDVMKGRCYSISVSAENVLGNNTATEVIVSVPLVIPSTSSNVISPTSTPSSTTSSTTSSISSSTSSSMTIISSTSTPACSSCSTSIALSVVLTFILTAVISVIISSLVTFLCTKSYYSKSQEPNIQSEPVEQVPMYEVIENIPSTPQTTNMSLTTNPAYGPVQH